MPRSAVEGIGVGGLGLQVGQDPLQGLAHSAGSSHLIALLGIEVDVQENSHLIAPLWWRLPIMRELINLWFAEAGANGAFPLDDRSPAEILNTPRPQLTSPRSR
jgi:hypothetical protein